MKPTRSPHETTALIAGVAAFMIWGLVPGYWKLLRFVPATEILAHRFVWTSVFMVLLLTWQQRWPEVLANLRSRRTALLCVASGAAIAINWFVFIWAVNAEHVLETSLGYFMSPLVNMLLGAIFLRERLTRAQFVSVLLASSAVFYLTFGFGRLPWVALALCFSFGLYGLLRKVSGAASIPGLFIETIVMMPVALIYLVHLGRLHTLQFGLSSPGTSLLLVSTGIVTGLPLLWFAHAARHLRLTTVGFLQYLSPSCTFFLGVFAFHEPFQRAQMLAFGLIWIALAVFTADAVTRWRSSKAFRPVGA